MQKKGFVGLSFVFQGSVMELLFYAVWIFESYRNAFKYVKESY